MNPKYDDAWFLKNNPQYWNNIRTTGLLRDTTKQEVDPVMLLNPTLYKQVQVSKGDTNFTDPFYKIMEQQDQWLGNNKSNAFIRDMVYRTDLDHPNSMHNVVTKQDSMQVQFPKSKYADGEALKFGLNGYYDKDAVGLKGGF